MSNEEKMREAFNGFWARNNPGLDESHKVVAWATFKACAAIKDAEIEELKDMHCNELLDYRTEIADLQRSVKELREVLHNITAIGMKCTQRTLTR